MRKDYYLLPSDIQIRGKNNYYNKSRLPLSYSTDLDYRFLNILEINKNNKLTIKENLDTLSFKNLNKNILYNYPDLKIRAKKISKNNSTIALLPKKNPLIMGILNITEDSFFDGGKFFKYKNALLQAEKLINAGADIIDIGGESTKPGSMPINIKEEINRVIPLIKKLSKNNVIVSCDTRNSSTMHAALDAGASIINDVSGLNYDIKTLNVIKQYNCLYVLMHSIETPLTMQNNPVYKNVTCDIYSFFKKKLLILKKKNISMKNIILDPGIGFGKTSLHNFSILENLSIFLDLNMPLLLGVSRKSLVKKFIKENNSKTLPCSITLALSSYLKGANILRVHDVKETLDAINIFKRAS